jgi:hypothetical protein
MIKSPQTDFGAQHWCRDFYHKELTMLGLDICEPNDIILFGDCDEIPEPSKLIFDGEKKGLWKFKTSKQEEPIVKKEIDEKPISTALPIKDVIEEKTREVVETKPTTATTYYLKDFTKLYYKKSNLNGPLYGSFKYYVKDTEVNVLPTEYNDVVEVTLKDGLKMYVKKEKLKELK